MVAPHGWGNHRLAAINNAGGAGSCCELGKDEGLDRTGEGCEHWGWDERLCGDIGRDDSGEDGR